jgi:hypothetical protein
VFVFKEVFADSKSSILFPLFIPFSSARNLTGEPEHAEKKLLPGRLQRPLPSVRFAHCAPRFARPEKEFAPLTTFVLGLRPKPQ